MSMVLRSNINSMNANRNLSKNNNMVAKSIEKLSSGYAINRAADDASGLAVSEKMRAQITGLDQGTSNTLEGIGLVQTAEGAMNEIHNMLNRMVELATKSANGTIQDEVDREAIQAEVDVLINEIDRIAESTNFNGIPLLNGMFDYVVDESKTYQVPTGNNTYLTSAYTTLISDDPLDKDYFEIKVEDDDGDIYTLTNSQLNGLVYLNSNNEFTDEQGRLIEIKVDTYGKPTEIVFIDDNGTELDIEPFYSAASSTVGSSSEIGAKEYVSEAIIIPDEALDVPIVGPYEIEYSMTVYKDVTTDVDNPNPTPQFETITFKLNVDEFGAITGSYITDDGSIYPMDKDYSTATYTTNADKYIDPLGDLDDPDNLWAQSEVDANTSYYFEEDSSNPGYLSSDSLDKIMGDIMSGALFTEYELYVGALSYPDSSTKVDNVVQVPDLYSVQYDTLYTRYEVPAVTDWDDDLKQDVIIQDAYYVYTPVPTTTYMTATLEGLTVDLYYDKNNDSLVTDINNHISRYDYVYEDDDSVNKVYSPDGAYVEYAKWDPIDEYPADGDAWYVGTSYNEDTGEWEDYGIPDFKDGEYYGNYVFSSEMEVSDKNGSNYSNEGGMHVWSEYSSDNQWIVIGAEIIVTSNGTVIAEQNTPGSPNEFDSSDWDGLVDMTTQPDAVDTPILGVDNEPEPNITEIKIPEPVTYEQLLNMSYEDRYDLVFSVSQELVYSNLESDIKTQTNYYVTIWEPKLTDNQIENLFPDYYNNSNFTIVYGEVDDGGIQEPEHYVIERLCTQISDDFSGNTFENILDGTTKHTNTTTCTRKLDEDYDVSLDANTIDGDRYTIQIGNYAKDFWYYGTEPEMTPVLHYDEVKVPITLHVADENEEYNKVYIYIDPMTGEALEIKPLYVDTQEEAGAAIEKILNAINYVSKNRADLGAIQNRLESIINVNNNTSENMTSARSVIKDCDMAKEMIQYTKMDVLTQSAQAMLAQSNAAPQAILELLG